MIKCILLDDELPSLSYIQALCENFKDVEIVKSFNNPQKFLAQIDRLDFNTCILDIHMPGMNGLEVARILSDKAIIFSTAHKEYAADAFDLNAVDYIRKPYQADRLQTAFDKALKWLNSTKETGLEVIELNSNQGKTRIRIDQIAYIEVADHDRRDKYIYMKIPEGFTMPEAFCNEHKSVYSIKLQKSLYGLKQSDRIWYNRLNE